MSRKRHIASVFFFLFLFCVLDKDVGFGAEICGYHAMGAIEVTREGKVIEDFTVTLAASAESQQRGLMNCPFLHPGTGMLFTYPDARRRVFWMKNTLIELAIIFISAEGSIVSIEHGEPGSLYRIHSSKNIQSVLEINYPESRRLAVGDIVRLRLRSDDKPDDELE
jgi:uncharacterized membrane protein (UPF0127 family)